MFWINKLRKEVLSLQRDSEEKLFDVKVDNYTKKCRKHWFKFLVGRKIFHTDERYLFVERDDVTFIQCKDFDGISFFLKWYELWLANNKKAKKVTKKK